MIAVAVVGFVVYAVATVGKMRSEVREMESPLELLETLPATPRLRKEIKGRMESAIKGAAEQTSAESRLEQTREAAGAARMLRDRFAPLTLEERNEVGAILYSLTRSQVAVSRLDEAEETLVEAVEAGWSDIGFVEVDRQIAALKARKGFAAILDQLRRTAEQNLRRNLSETREDSLDFEVTDVDGATHSMLEWRGRVVLVDCWGTWCKPCLEMTPDLIRLNDAFPAEEFQIIGLNYERDSPREASAKVLRYIEQHEVDFPCALVKEQRDGNVPRVKGYPTLYFIGRDGQVRRSGEGVLSYWLMETIVKILLEEPRPDEADSE